MTSKAPSTAKRRPGRPPGPNQEYRPLNARELGILEGMAASGATDGMIRKRLGIRGGWWQWLGKNQPEAVDALCTARQEAQQLLSRALYRAAITSKGTLKKGGQALKAAALFARITGMVRPDNVNVAVNTAPTGSLLVAIPEPGISLDDLEARISQRQDELQRTAKLVRLPGPQYEERAEPNTPAAPLGRDNPVQDADFEVLPNDFTPRITNDPTRKRS